MVYLITYDLRKDKDYNRLYEGLTNSFKDYIRPLESVWLINSSLPIDSVDSIVRALVDANDLIYITAIKIAGTGVLQNMKDWDWIKRKINPLDSLKPPGVSPFLPKK